MRNLNNVEIVQCEQFIEKAAEKNRKIRRVVAKVGITAFATAFMATPAYAAIDLTAVSTAFTADMIPALVTIGGLLILAAVTAVTFKWIKGMLFS